MEIQKLIKKVTQMTSAEFAGTNYILKIKLLKPPIGTEVIYLAANEEVKKKAFNGKRIIFTTDDIIRYAREINQELLTIEEAIESIREKDNIYF